MLVLVSLLIILNSRSYYCDHGKFIFIEFGMESFEAQTRILFYTKQDLDPKVETIVDHGSKAMIMIIF